MTFLQEEPHVARPPRELTVPLRRIEVADCWADARACGLKGD
ncbi:MAG: hypothetical protein PHQ34_03535 [Methanothrix sp.]|nr:hypothetical protein [Methanothrix sp.]